MSAKPQPRVTQKMIAEAAGVSRVTVTYALKNNPKLPEDTRERIQQLAKEMGYMPDPMLSSLAYYRNRQRPAGFHGTLAWLVKEQSNSSSWWQDSPHYSPYHTGASRRAPWHGYKLEDYYFNDTSMPLKRVESIMTARNIAGILLCPLPRLHSQIDLSWSKFSVIALGYTLQKPKLHTVASAHFQNVRRCMARLRDNGYKRIGLMIPRMTDLRCNSFVSGAYMTEQLSQDGNNSTNIPPLFHVEPIGNPDNADYMDAVLDYVMTHKLDAVLTNDDHLLERIGRIRNHLPENFAIACISLPRRDSGLSGFIEDSEAIGAVAIDMLAAMIQRGERGIPSIPVHSHVEGFWTDSNSMPLPPVITQLKTAKAAAKKTRKTAQRSKDAKSEKASLAANKGA